MSALAHSLRHGWQACAVPTAGLALMTGIWWLAIHLLGPDAMLAQRFAPAEAWQALQQLVLHGDGGMHVRASLQRVALGLLLALAVGIPLGLLVGCFPLANRLTSTSFQVLRMTSPLSWMPLAVMVLGVGEAPVVFLVAFAATWPIVLNVAAGIRAIDPQWLTLAASLGANRRERLWHFILPAIASHLLTGVRLAIGLIWVVLVPAEMLGVQAGLGYFILDTRDRMAYDELMATILLIGLLGWLLDSLAYRIHRHWSDA